MRDCISTSFFVFGNYVFFGKMEENVEAFLSV